MCHKLRGIEHLRVADSNLRCVQGWIFLSWMEFENSLVSPQKLLYIMALVWALWQTRWLVRRLFNEAVQSAEVIYWPMRWSCTEDGKILRRKQSCLIVKVHWEYLTAVPATRPLCGTSASVAAFRSTSGTFTKYPHCTKLTGMNMDWEKPRY